MFGNFNLNRALIPIVPLLVSGSSTFVVHRSVETAIKGVHVVVECLCVVVSMVQQVRDSLSVIIVMLGKTTLLGPVKFSLSAKIWHVVLVFKKQQKQNPNRLQNCTRRVLVRLMFSRLIYSSTRKALMDCFTFLSRSGL